jgi:hypothetical protein
LPLDVNQYVGLRLQDQLDATQPDISHKTLLSMTEGYGFLQGDVCSDLSSMKSNLASTIRVLSRPDWISRSTFKEANLIERVKNQQPSISREASVRAKLNSAFEAIIDPPQRFGDSAPGRLSGSFDSPTPVNAEDLAPYVRCIVASDMRLEQQRLELSKLLSRGGPSGKTRTTRASRAALEGGNKATTRRERYLPKATNFSQVLSTGQKSWQEALVSFVEEAGEPEDLGTSPSESPGSPTEFSTHD